MYTAIHTSARRALMQADPGRAHYRTSFFEDTVRLLDIPGEHVAVSGLSEPSAGVAIRRIDVLIRVDWDRAPLQD